MANGRRQRAKRERRCTNRTPDSAAVSHEALRRSVVGQARTRLAFGIRGLPAGARAGLHAEKLLPQLQEVLALGFRKAKPPLTIASE